MLNTCDGRQLEFGEELPDNSDQGKSGAVDCTARPPRFAETGPRAWRWKTFGRGIYLFEFKHVTVLHEESTSQVIVEGTTVSVTRATFCMATFQAATSARGTRPHDGAGRSGPARLRN
jgi:hypothetical protein